jgi:hypothetical protein
MHTMTLLVQGSLVVLAFSIFAAAACAGPPSTMAGTGAVAPAKGPLKVLAGNPRYFTDGTGKAIYLTGSLTWSNQNDQGTTDPPPVFDFNGYLDFLQAHNHNFIRLRRKELTQYSFGGLYDDKMVYVGGAAAVAADRARPGPGRQTQVRPEQV